MNIKINHTLKELEFINMMLEVVQYHDLNKLTNDEKSQLNNMIDKNRLVIRYLKKVEE